MTADYVHVTRCDRTAYVNLSDADQRRLDPYWRVSMSFDLLVAESLTQDLDGYVI